MPLLFWAFPSLHQDRLQKVILPTILVFAHLTSQELRHRGVCDLSLSRTDLTPVLSELLLHLFRELGRLPAPSRAVVQAVPILYAS